jgi:hypothetical protein
MRRVFCEWNKKKNTHTVSYRQADICVYCDADESDQRFDHQLNIDKLTNYSFDSFHSTLIYFFFKLNIVTQLLGLQYAYHNNNIQQQ